MKKTFVVSLVLVTILSFSNFISGAQMITGVWHGKINKQKVEVKIIQSGDSLTGTSYYYESANNYRRYSIRGYFDQTTNSTVWWDDELIEEKAGKYSSTPGKVPLLSRADFNCPGGGVMMLDGKAALKEDNAVPKGDLHLDKTEASTFPDEWNFVIDNYLVGANDPDIIDSVNSVAKHETIPAQPETIVATAPPAKEPEVITRQKPIEQPAVKKEEPKQQPQVVTKVIESSKAPTIEEKFLTRKKVFNKEIQLEGDSIELRFYDNAEIDGDSISLFLNDQLIFEHIRLTEKAYIIKLAVSELKASNELIMVAENLGSIPPNTSYMLAIVGDKRYDAYLASTENSSAMIRFVKKPSKSL
ncbi:MAG: hypothetical protein JSS70_18095 [Bacteroidetes bacterium]|nr:hypothetical protein [Bacteroidota bacterium]